VMPWRSFADAQLFRRLIPRRWPTSGLVFGRGFVFK
jgi:hypothetical protein